MYEPLTRYLSGVLAVAKGTFKSLVASGELSLTGEQLFTTTGTNSDVALSGGVTFFRGNFASSASITGFTGGYVGRLLVVVNESASSTLTLSHQTASSASNQITGIGGADVQLSGVDSSAFLRYDGSKWRVIGLASNRFGGTATFAGGATMSGTFAAGATISYTTTLTPSSISGTVNDWSVGTAGWRYRVAATAAAIVTGLSTGSGTTGRLTYLQNIGTFNITLTHEGAGSTAANRFSCPRSVDLVMPPNGGAFLLYDGTLSRWVVYPDGSCWSQGASTLSGDLISPPWTSGRYYLLPAMSVATGTSAAMGNGTLRFSLFYVPSPVTLTRIGAEITVAGEAGSKVRLGIYADDGNGRPGALVVDAGQIDGTITGTQELAISTPAGPGWYWYATAVQSAPTTQPTIRTATTVPYNNDAGTTLPATLTGSTSQGATQSGVTGALPNPAVITSMASGTTARAVVKT